MFGTLISLAFAFFLFLYPNLKSLPSLGNLFLF